MKLFNKLCLLLFLLGGPTALPATGRKAYTLEDCVREALRNNARIQNARNDLAAARHGQMEAFTKYFPVLGASGGGFVADKGWVEMALPSQPGQSVSMLKDGIVGGITATLPLFAGGQIMNGHKLAEVKTEAARWQVRRSENEVRLTTEQYFWQIVALEAELQTLATVEEQLESICKDVDAAVQAGVNRRNDLLQADLRKNETQSNRVAVENALATSRSLLAQYMGHAQEQINVIHCLTDSLPAHPQDVYVEPSSSLLLTHEYNLLQQNTKAARLQHKLSVGKHLPSIAIGGGYLYNNLLDKGRAAWTGFATVSIPLSGWWGGAHELKRQKLQVRNAENRLADQTQLLLIRMANAWNDLTDAYKQVGIAKDAIAQATENLRLQTDYYRAGTCSMSDLLEAQTLFQQSRNRYVDAYVQYVLKKREYLLMTGRA